MIAPDGSEARPLRHQLPDPRRDRRRPDRHRQPRARRRRCAACCRCSTARPFIDLRRHGGLRPRHGARRGCAARGRISFPLVEDEIPRRPSSSYDISGPLTDVSSDVLIDDKLLVADALELHASNTGIEVTGPVRIGLAARRRHLDDADGQRGDGLPAASPARSRSPRPPQRIRPRRPEGMVSGSTRGRFDIELGARASPAARAALRSRRAGDEDPRHRLVASRRTRPGRSASPRCSATGRR